LLVVVLAIIGVVIAKEATNTRSPNQSEVGAEVAARSAPSEAEASRGNPATGPASSGQRESSKATPAGQEKPEGPLPGSKLADCLKSGRPTLADFGKEWCEPCKAMVPVLKQAAQDYRGKASIVFVNLEEYPDLDRQYRIAAMPTQIFFDGKGKEIKRHMGYMSAEEVARELAALGVKR
jgi:thioredoxin 1